jgi:hypothetical protein
MTASLAPLRSLHRTMPLRPVELPDDVPGNLLLSSMPGRFEPWNEFLREARHACVARVVCLTAIEEVATLSPAYHDALTSGSLPWTMVSLPMDDFGVHESDEAFCDGVIAIAKALCEGETVVMHCAAGIGRTGTAAACVLKRLGLPASDALERVQDAGSNPQSAVQSGLIDRF